MCFGESPHPAGTFGAPLPTMALRDLLKTVYHSTHDLAFGLLPYNPLFAKVKNGKAVKYGHVSTEHLDDPRLDDQLVESLRAQGIAVAEFDIDIPAYAAYLARADYPDDYFGGGRDPRRNFTEKTLEHYVSTKFMSLNPESLFVDMAACTSPFYEIIERQYGVAQSYQQDLVYAPGQHGRQIGGYGHELPFAAESIDAVTLHCSLEHFEGNSDVLFFRAMERQLKPGGRVIVLPFYIAHEYTIHVDPIYNTIKRHSVDLDDSDQFRLRYADWYQFYSRHYDAATLKARVLDQCPGLRLTVYRVRNFREVDARCYLRFVGVFEKLA